MGFAPVKVGEEIDVRIEAVGEKGDGIARKRGFILFVPNAREGDEVKIRVTKVLRKVGFAEVVGQATGPVEGSQPEPGQDAPAAPEPMPEPEPAPEDSEDFGEEPAEEPAEETPAEETAPEPEAPAEEPTPEAPADEAPVEEPAPEVPPEPPAMDAPPEPPEEAAPEEGEEKKEE
jgi:predicted RNA-binding protein with TRAM domain